MAVRILPILFFLWILLFVAPMLRAQQQALDVQILNVIDSKGLKQGVWRIDDKKQGYETGEFINGKKHGVWKAYYAGGQLKYQVTFSNGLAKGPAVFYFEDGTKSEEGYWDVNHWEGDYKFYSESGHLFYHFQFNAHGKREGVQKYFHENGVVKCQGEWMGGKPQGAVKMYTSSGQLQSVRTYNNGRFVSVEEKTVLVGPSNDFFHGTGNFTLYNTNGQVRQKGYFEDGNFMKGEWFYYYENGKLKYTDIYIDGVKVERVYAE